MTMHCTTCHQPLPSDASFCPGCGAQVQLAVTGATQRLGSSTKPSCPKCHSEMERGFIPDEFRDHDEVTVWVRGEPRRHPSTAVVELGGSRMWQVVTYRCLGCGYLESYARHEITIE